MMVIRFGRQNGVYPEFSNFWNCSNMIEYGGLRYSNAEAIFQSQKTLDRSVQETFTRMNGSQAKKAGRDVSLRSDWEDIKFDIMCNVVYAKFTQDQKLRDLLLSTGNAYLVEDTSFWHDNTWGCCTCKRCSYRQSRNLLGLSLMYARARIQGLNECIVEIQFGNKVFHKDLYTLRQEAGGVQYNILIDSINRKGI